jgi:hypothetical protein
MRWVEAERSERRKKFPKLERGERMRPGTKLELREDEIDVFNTAFFFVH